MPVQRDIGEPHAKPYMPTRLGRALERSSYRDLGVASLCVFVVATLYFAFAPEGHGIASAGGSASTVLEAAYFSVVTFTSLGYGDYAPEGAGRLVASGLVLFGLAVVALFIGKVASERSQATLFLLHTSDRDRRLRGFAEAIASESDRLSTSVSNLRAGDIRKNVQELTGVLEGISNYIAFHAHHSSLGGYGNTPALFRLLRELRILCKPILDAMLLPATDVDLQRRLDATVDRIVGLVRFMIAIQSRRGLDWTGTALASIRSARPVTATPCISESQSRIERGLLEDIAKGRLRATSVLTEAMLSRVLGLCSAGPLSGWARHDHKRISAHLRVSNKLVVRSIDALLAQGRLPK